MAAEKAKSIAVAVDGSEAGWEAMNRAVNMARLLELPLDVLHVVQLRKAGYFAFIDRHLMEDQEAYAKQVLAEAGQRGQKRGWKSAPTCWKGNGILRRPSSSFWKRPGA